MDIERIGHIHTHHHHHVPFTAIVFLQRIVQHTFRFACVWGVLVEKRFQRETTFPVICIREKKRQALTSVCPIVCVFNAIK